MTKSTTKNTATPAARAAATRSRKAQTANAAADAALVTSALAKTAKAVAAEKAPLHAATDVLTGETVDARSAPLGRTRTAKGDPKAAAKTVAKAAVADLKAKRSAEAEAAVEARANGSAAEQAVAKRPSKAVVAKQRAVGKRALKAMAADLAAKPKAKPARAWTKTPTPTAKPGVEQLTADAIDAFPLPAKGAPAKFLRDGDGSALLLRVFDSGTRVWMVEAVEAGKKVRRKLGNFPEMSIAQARKSTAAKVKSIESGEPVAASA